jgi:short-subunit dehydrogenase
MQKAWFGKTAVVSGGSRGLGLHIAKELANQQAHLVLIGRDADNLSAQSDHLLHSGASSVDCFACDAMEIASQAAYRTRIEKTGVDLLINAIGVSDRGNLEQLQLDDLQHQFRANVLAGWSMIKHTLPSLKQNKGCIVNIGSLAGLIGTPNMGGYCITKFAWTALSRQWRMELKQDGVHLLLVSPGPIAREDSEHRYDKLIAKRGIESKGASKPGGGAKLRRIDPILLSQRILSAAARREKEIVMPWKARILAALFSLSPTLGEFLLGRNLDRS